jgi:hypothetical protein
MHEPEMHPEVRHPDEELESARAEDLIHTTTDPLALEGAHAMETKTLEELANDPVMGKEVRDISNFLHTSGVKEAAPENTNANGNTGNTGATGDNERLREITQDRPSPHLQTYTLATPTPVIAAEQAAIRDGGKADLSWHHDLIKHGREIENPGPERSKEKSVEQPDQSHAKQPEHPRDPKGRGR